MENVAPGASGSDPATILDQCSATQRAILEALLRQPDGRSVDDLVDAVGVTANAVRQHLATLEKEGLVRYEVRPIARGRPQHRYRLTGRGQEAFPRRYRELAEAVLQELGQHVKGPALAEAMRSMGGRAAAGMDARDVPVAGAARLLAQLGYEATATSGREIVARNCVFHRLAERFPAVCEFDLGFMEAATGRKVEHRECMVRGGTCCRFRFGK